MSAISEMNKFRDAVKSIDFDYANASKYLVTRNSYHMNKSKEKKIINNFLSDEYIEQHPQRPIVSADNIQYISKTDEEFHFFKALNAIYQSVFLPIVINEEYISIYQFWGSPNGCDLIEDVPYLSKQSNGSVIGFWRDIDNVERYLELGAIPHELHIKTKNGLDFHYYRNAEGNVNDFNIIDIEDLFGCKLKREELEELFSKEPDDLFDEIGVIMGFCTWFPKELLKRKPDQERGHVRIYRI